jgi:hypothetical protein
VTLIRLPRQFLIPYPARGEEVTNALRCCCDDDRPALLRLVLALAGYGASWWQGSAQDECGRRGGSTR